MLLTRGIAACEGGVDECANLVPKELFLRNVWQAATVELEPKLFFNDGAIRRLSWVWDAYAIPRHLRVLRGGSFQHGRHRRTYDDAIRRKSRNV